MSAPIAPATGNRTEHIADPQLARVQTAIQAQIPNATTCPLLNGKLFEKVTITTGTTSNIAHGLSRAWKGFIVCGQSSATAIISLAATQQDATKFVSIDASATTTVTLWVF